jgi:hypothetical protein
MESSTEGVLVPRMTTAQRDAITHHLNSLTIFNTDQQCFNVWNDSTSQWQSLCMTPPPATLTINCGSATVNGYYFTGVPTDATNYLSLPVTVNTPGNFTLSVTTGNGYSFAYQGSAPEAGAIIVNVPAQGTPTNAKVDTISLQVNGGTQEPCPSTTVTVNVPTVTYALNCGNTQVVGNFVNSTVYGGTGTSYIQTSVTVANAAGMTSGTYTVVTDTLNGISFRGQGTWATKGSTYSLNIYPTGTLTSSQPDTFTLYVMNGTTIQDSCTAVVVPTLPPLTFLSVGGADDYVPEGDQGVNDASYWVSHSPYNFGPTGTVKYANNGITWINGGTYNFSQYLSPATSSLTFNGHPIAVDVVYIGYGGDMSATDASALVTYIKAGGVVWLADPVNSITDATIPNNNANWMGVLNGLYNSTTQYQGEGGGYNNMYPLIAPSSDPLMNGPFGDLTGANWAEDGGGSAFVTPPTGAIVYSNAYTAYGAFSVPAGTLIPGYVSVFRDPSYNFVYSADGGWLISYGTSANNYTSGNYPAWYGAAPTYAPGSRVYNAYGSNGISASNTVLWCNWLAWAMQQAVTTGYNHQYY